MNYLELSNKLHEKTGESGADIVSVVGLSGYQNRLVGYVKDAWMEIQTLHTTWRFMRHEALPTLLSGGNTLDANAWVLANKGIQIDEYHKDTFSIYETALGVADETRMNYTMFERWKEYFGLQYDNGEAGRPVSVTIIPSDDTLKVGPVADKNYTVSFEFNQSPIELAANSDTPNIASALHMIIVWRALELYGYAEESKWLVEQGRKNYRKLLRRLQRRELPEVTIGEPLA